MIEELGKIALENRGFVTAAEVSHRGIQRRWLSRAVIAGKLVKVDRGLYCTPETWADEYVLAQHRFARGIFSHDTALYLFGLSDQAPEALTMSFPRGYNVTRAKRAGLTTKSSPAGLDSLGATTVSTPFGNTVTCYDAERTLCDMLRGVSIPDLQLVNPAMRSYLSSSHRSIPKLQSYAKSLGVEKKIKSYLMVML